MESHSLHLVPRSVPGPLSAAHRAQRPYLSACLSVPGTERNEAKLSMSEAKPG